MTTNQFGVTQYVHAIFAWQETNLALNLFMCYHVFAQTHKTTCYSPQYYYSCYYCTYYTTSSTNFFPRIIKSKLIQIVHNWLLSPLVFTFVIFPWINVYRNLMMIIINTYNCEFFWTWIYCYCKIHMNNFITFPENAFCLL
jgi:hypothetical protein